MHWSGILLYAVILLWAVPAMFVHRTAIVLVATWLAGQIWWYQTGDKLPITLYMLTDAIAFGLIMSWRTSWADTAVLCIYPMMWACYAAGFSGYLDQRSLWWLLYIFALSQFVIAGPWPFFSRNRTPEGRRVGRRVVGLAKSMTNV